MRIGLLVGYAVLGLVDALVPSVAVAWLVLEVGYWVPAIDDLRLALVAGACGLGFGFCLGFASAWRGGRPFPLTRAVGRLFERFWWI